MKVNVKFKNLDSFLGDGNKEYKFWGIISNIVVWEKYLIVSDSTVLALIPAEIPKKERNKIIPKSAWKEAKRNIKKDDEYINIEVKKEWQNISKERLDWYFEVVKGIFTDLKNSIDKVDTIGLDVAKLKIIYDLFVQDKRKLQFSFTGKRSVILVRPILDSYFEADDENNPYLNELRKLKILLMPFNIFNGSK